MKDTEMFSIDSYVELLALHRALLELQWVSEPNDPAIIGSSFVADIANRVLDELIAIENAAKRTSRAEDWRQWRELTPDRREFQRLKKRLESLQQWETDEEQKECIRCLASPFVLSDDLIETLIRRGEKEDAASRRPL